MEYAIAAVSVFTALANCFTVYVLYRFAKRENLVRIDVPRTKKKVVVIKGSPTFGEAFLEDLKQDTHG